MSQELRSPLNGMVGLTMALCKSPTMSPAIKKQPLGHALRTECESKHGSHGRWFSEIGMGQD